MCRNVRSNNLVSDEATEVRIRASRIKGIMRVLRIRGLIPKNAPALTSWGSVFR